MLGALIFGAIAPVHLQARTCFWFGMGDGVSWHDPLNWAEGILPVAGDDVYVGGTDDQPVVLSGAAVTGPNSVHAGKITIDEATLGTVNGLFLSKS